MSKRFTLVLPDDLHAELTQYCETYMATASRVVITGIRMALDKNKQPVPQKHTNAPVAPPQTTKTPDKGADPSTTLDDLDFSDEDDAPIDATEAREQYDKGPTSEDWEYDSEGNLYPVEGD